MRPARSADNQEILKRYFLTEAADAPEPEIPEEAPKKPRKSREIAEPSDEVGADPFGLGELQAAAGTESHEASTPYEAGDLKTDLPTYCVKAAFHYLAGAYALKQPILIYGDAGIGKSSITRQFAERLAQLKNKTFFVWSENKSNKDLAIKQDAMANPDKYFVFIDVRCAQLNPEDLVGIPDIESKEEYIEMKQPKWVWYLSKPDADGILFLDEINQGSQSLLKSLFQLVLDRQVAGTVLSKHFGLVAAGNLATQYGNETIPPALTNRFLAGVLVVNPQDWLEWATEKRGSSKQVKHNSNDRLYNYKEGEDETNVDSSIINYVAFDPTVTFFAKPSDADPNSPFVTPRSLVSLSKFIRKEKHDFAEAAKRGERLPYSIYDKIKGWGDQLCGVKWTTGFVTYLRHIGAFRWAELMAKPEEFNNFDTQKRWAGVEYITSNLMKATAPGKAETPESQKKFLETVNFLVKLNNPEYAAWILKHFKQQHPQQFDKFTEWALLNGNYDQALKAGFNEVIKKVKGISGKAEPQLKKK